MGMTLEQAISNGMTADELQGLADKMRLRQQ